MSASRLLALFAFSARFPDIDRILRPNPKGAPWEGQDASGCCCAERLNERVRVSAGRMAGVPLISARVSTTWPAGQRGRFQSDS